jgi:hypothetical protein
MCENAIVDADLTRLALLLRTLSHACSDQAANPVPGGSMFRAAILAALTITGAALLAPVAAAAVSGAAEAARSGRSTPGTARSRCQASFRRVGLYTPGDQASGNPALAISRGSCDAPYHNASRRTPPLGHALVPIGFRLRVSPATQEPPSEYFPAVRGASHSPWTAGLRHAAEHPELSPPRIVGLMDRRGAQPYGGSALARTRRRAGLSFARRDRT